LEGALTRPWETLECVPTQAGDLALRRRAADDFLITLGSRILMTSRAHRSEIALADHACTGLAEQPEPRVLIGGLGMAYTLRAALDRLPPDARVVVAELEEAVVRWCRGPLAALTQAAVEDPRVELHVEDVTRAWARAGAGGARRFDAIAIDLFEGPRGTRAEVRHPLYGDAALALAHRALRPGGVLALWSETPAAAFEKRFGASGFAVRRHREGKGGRRHAIYVGTALAARQPGGRAHAWSRRRG
jgi:spermidine synthase